MNDPNDTINNNRDGNRAAARQRHHERGADETVKDAPAARASHTPGPWEHARANDGVPTPGDIRARMPNGTPFVLAEVRGFGREAVANGDVMAAAPDMLAALLLIDPLGDLSLARDIKAALATQAERDAFDRAIASVRAAIRKAKGG